MPTLMKETLEAIHDMGLTVPEVEKAKCIVTAQGMYSLRPCEWAKRWIIARGRAVVTPKVVREWTDQYPDAWLTATRDSSIGPEGGWPWGDKFKDTHWTEDFDEYNVLMLLKAYIVKHGKRS